MTKLQELIDQIAVELKGTNASGKGAPWWILERITGKTQITLLMEEDFKLTKDEQIKLATWLKALREKNYPLQYLFGSVPFLGLNILVEPPILIPRPETEEWVDNLISQLKHLRTERLLILDIGVGSGCIGLAIAKAFPKWKVLGVDISDKAIALAEKNKKENNIENINFIKSDLFDCVPEIKFDLIVSNPPYISQEQYEKLDNSVAHWEDKQALVGSDDGLEIIRKIINSASNYLSNRHKNIPALILEIDDTHAEIVPQLLKNAGFVKTEINKDFAGKNRTALGYFDN